MDDFLALVCDVYFVFSSPEPKAIGELNRMGLEPASIGPWVHPFTLSNMNISETSCPIKIKFHLEHHWGRGLAASGFGQDWIRTLVSMATTCSYRVIMG